MRSRERLAIREREITDLWRLRLEEREHEKKNEQLDLFTGSKKKGPLYVKKKN